MKDRGEGRDGIVERRAQEAPGARVEAPPVIYVTCKSHVLPTRNCRSPLAHRRARSTLSLVTPKSWRSVVQLGSFLNLE